MDSASIKLVEGPRLVINNICERIAESDSNYLVPIRSYGCMKTEKFRGKSEYSIIYFFPLSLVMFKCFVSADDLK